MNNIQSYCNCNKIKFYEKQSKNPNFRAKSFTLSELNKIISGLNKGQIPQDSVINEMRDFLKNILTNNHSDNNVVQKLNMALNKIDNWELKATKSKLQTKILSLKVKLLIASRDEMTVLQKQIEQCTNLIKEIDAELKSS